MRSGSPSPSKQTICLQDGMTPGPRGWVIDSFRDARLAVTDEEWELLSLVATHGRISISQLVPAQLACLRSLGEEFFRRSSDPRNRWRRCTISGLLGLPRRIGVQNSIWMAIRLIWWAGVALRWIAYLTIGLALLLVVVLDAPITAAVVLVMLPMVIYLSIGIHELGHLLVLRWVLVAPRLGALWCGRTGIAIVRPRMKGRQLRAVAAAGPVAGCLAALAPLPLAGRVPGVVLAVVVALLLNVLSLLPVTGDGHALWFGEEPSSDTRRIVPRSAQHA